MHWLDWLIVVIPVTAVLWLAFYSRKYVRSVVDYLAAGRVAGRYVIGVSDMSSTLSVIVLVAMVEERYLTGFARSYWGNIVAPVGMVMALTGYCTYRFRETKALSFGQFIEMRYCRSLRIFASFLRTLSEMLYNAIGPAITANFFVYYLGLPHKISVFGFSLPSFFIVVSLTLIISVMALWPSGRISLLITDCIQGLFSYPIFLIIAAYVVMKFSWGGDVIPAVSPRVPGESFMNPLDMSKLRDFNIFATVAVVTSQVINYGSWIGNDTSNCGRTPHEQKMAGILGAWRNGMAYVMCTLIAVLVITLMNNAKFAEQARDIRCTLINKIADKALSDDAVKAKVAESIAAVPKEYPPAPYSAKNNPDARYLAAVHDAVGHDAAGNLRYQNIRSVYSQMLMPQTLRYMLPVGLAGIVALLMLLLLISTDDSRIFNAASTLTQDVILPWIKHPLDPKTHIWILRLVAVGIAVFFLVVSVFFTQLDFINMFLHIVSALWLGGAGPVVLFGLYSRFGTTAGAYASIFAGSGTAALGLFLQRNWADVCYPFLVGRGWDKPVGAFLEMVSAPFAPYVQWTMDPVKFPINSYEVSFLAIIFGIIAYVVVSLLTCREPYNLDRLLHRGIYRDPGEPEPVREKWTWKNIFRKIISITPDYTRGDRFIAYLVFSYGFVYSVGISFIGTLIWNLIKPWPEEWWGYYFFINNILVASAIGIISTVWFSIGGVIDLRRLFRDLEKRVVDPLDNGQVSGGIALNEAKRIEEIENKK